MAQLIEALANGDAIAATIDPKSPITPPSVPQFAQLLIAARTAPTDPNT